MECYGAHLYKSVGQHAPPPPGTSVYQGHHLCRHVGAVLSIQRMMLERKEKSSDVQVNIHTYIHVVWGNRESTVHGKKVCAEQTR